MVKCPQNKVLEWNSQNQYGATSTKQGIAMVEVQKNMVVSL